MNYSIGLHIRRVILSISILAVLSVPPFSFAAVSYSRSPSGTLITSPVSVSLSFSGIADFGWSNSTYYQMIINGVNYVDVLGVCRSVGENSIVENFTLPIGLQTDLVWMRGFTDAICDYPAPIDQEYTLETAGGNGILFSIVSRIESAPTSVIAHRPEVTIAFPKEGDFVGATTTIRYTAVDEDTAKYPPFGFGAKPISIYYSDERDPIERGWFRIAEDQPNTGEFVWDSSFLRDGTYYLRMVAKDDGGERDEDISGPFGIDTIPPIFDVSVEPPVSKGDKVKIVVEPSEPLGSAPVVIVRQRGFTDIEVPMRLALQNSSEFGEVKEGLPSKILQGKTLDGERWEGIYEVRQNFDGTARVRVSGKDRAGNISATIRRGGTFSVGINPPPPPVVIRPLNNDIFATSSVMIEGTIREDAKAIVFMNDEKIGTFAPDAEGKFRAAVTLSEIVPRGVNFARVSSEDVAGNMSDPVVLALTLNQPPELVIAEPVAGAILHGTTTISLQSRDANKDRLLFSYEISSDGGASWISLASRTTRPEIAWDTIAFPDGEYRLAARANDGAVETLVEIASVIIQNFRPIVSFANGARSVINSRDASFAGAVKSPVRPSGQIPPIRSLEYRVNGGFWSVADAGDGLFDSSDERFRFALAGLVEGRHRIEVRARNARGLYGYATHELVVDFGPPQAPVVVSPASGAILGDADDTDTEVAGVQFVLAGRAEPGSAMRVSVGDKIFSGVAASDGAFRVEGVTLREHGASAVLAVAEDAAGNKSDAASASYFYNNPPRILFLSPRDKDGLNHRAAIEWDIRDPDGDSVKNAALSYRRGNGAFVSLVRNPVEQKFVWDVGGLRQGDDYQLKLEASDGASVSESIIGISIDNAAPAIAVSPFRETAFVKKFILKAEGSASDDFSGVQFVEYAAYKKGTPARDVRWFKALVVAGFRSRNAAFRLTHPFQFEDGEYEVGIRAVDVAGNVSDVFFQKIIVDTTPPRVGSYTISRGHMTIFPEADRFRLLSGVSFRFLLSLERDAKEAALAIAGKSAPLLKNNATGLWEGEVMMGEATITPLLLSARDIVGNGFLEKPIGALESVLPGRVTASAEDGGGAIADARIGISVFDDEEKKFRRLQAESYGGENPVITNDDGRYELLLPAGRYSLLAQKSGFARARSEEFEITHPRFVAVNFSLPRRAGIRGFIENFIEYFISL